ncbi:hypothetical protein CPB85DRAFT_1378674 [Mucidula mucida]|nr:hypothetical protein CPB85DRAFT_1378674 [Mucidula mucida]
MVVTVGIIGSGTVGLVSSHDKTPGGIWARERIYPGLALNNNAEKTGGRLGGEDMRRYMTKFASRFLEGNIQYETEVLRIRRVRWRVTVRKQDGLESTLSFDKLVLCSGGCTVPKIPSYLSQDAALEAGFRGPSQFWTCQRRPKSEDLLRQLSYMATCLAKEGRKIIMVFEKVDAYMGGAKPLPDFMRKSRRFLHTTNLGAKIFTAYDLPADSPLCNAQSPFWTVRRDDSFFSLCNSGKIQLLTPKKFSGFGPDGNSLRLSDGSRGCGSCSHYVTLQNPPPAHTKEEQWASSIYRGIVPAKNLLQRDFAINGAVAFELIAHWISSYFLADAMNLPPNPEAAKREADRYANWTRKRWPDQLLYLNESFSAAVYFFAWPQYINQLLADMRLPGMRSGGNWLTWPFKTIDVAEIANLKAERDDLRRKTKV